MKYALLFISITMLFTACKTGNKATNRNNLVADSGREMKLFEGNAADLHSDYFTLDSLVIDGDILRITASYGGGCGDAVFDLYYTNRIMESMPPKTVLLLVFTDNDPCRAIVNKTLEFSLEPFRSFAENDGIVVKISGTDKTALYKSD